jgi:hypothetical protein
MARETTSKTRTHRPKGDAENTSNRNPAINAAIIPVDEEGDSNRFNNTNPIITTFNSTEEEKWTRKLV